MKTPDAVTIVKAGEEHQGKASAALDFIENEATIENLADYVTAPRVIADLKTQRDALDAQRKEWTGPLNAVVKSINSAFKPATEFYDKAEAILKERLSTFYHSQTEHRTKLLQGVERASDEDRGVLMAQADEAELPKLKGVSYRVSWTGEVLNGEELKSFLIENNAWEFLVPDVKALQAHSKALKGKVDIPGWRAFQKTVVAISKSLAK
jgi:hypothetical protein